MSQRITIEYEVGEYGGQFKVDASDFAGLSDEQIEREIQDMVDADAKSNVDFFAQNVAKTVEAIKEALKIEAAEEAEENA